MKTKIFFSFTGFLMVVCLQTFAAIGPAKGQPLSDSLLIKPHYVGKKNVVRLQSNTSSGTLNVNSRTEEELHFYIFDLDGVMLYRSVLKGHEDRSIPGLRKGIYTYDVFCNDESIEQGNIIVK